MQESSFTPVYPTLTECRNLHLHLSMQRLRLGPCHSVNDPVMIWVMFLSFSHHFLIFCFVLFFKEAVLLLFQHSVSSGVHIFVLDLPTQQLPDLQECESLRRGEGRNTDGSTSAPEWCGEGEGALQNHDCRLWLNSYRCRVLARTSRVRDPPRITRLTSLSKRTSKQSLPTRPNLLPYTKEVLTFRHVF